MTVQQFNINDGSSNVTAGNNYVTVAASATTTALAVSLGRAGDWLSGLLVVPAATSTSGAVSIKDSTGGTAITLFAGGTTAITNLVPFFIPVGARSSSGGWFVTTGSSVSCVATGNFS